MKLLNNPKTITIICYVLIIVVGFSAFAAVRNRELLLGGEGISFTNVYLLLVLLILFISIIFGVTLKVVNNYNDDLKTIDVEMDALVTEEESALTEEVEITHDIKIKDKDKEAIINKIIPKEKGMSILNFTESLLRGIAAEFNIVVGITFVFDSEQETYIPAGKYAYFAEEEPVGFKVGESLNGQAAKNKTPLKLNEIPEGYINVVSGLGAAIPQNLLILPVVHNDKCLAVLELGTFNEINDAKLDVLNSLTGRLGSIINGILQ